MDHAKFKREMTELAHYLWCVGVDCEQEGWDITKKTHEAWFNPVV